MISFKNIYLKIFFIIFIIGHWPQSGCNPVTQGFLKVSLKCIFLNKMSSIKSIILKLEEIYDYCF